PTGNRAKDGPEGDSRIVERMMAKSPERRYTTLREVLKDIESAEKGQEVKVEAAAAKKEEASALAVPTRLAAVGTGTAAAPVEIERPRSFYYLAGSLAASALLAVAIGVGPLRDILAEGSEAQQVNPREA